MVNPKLLKFQEGPTDGEFDDWEESQGVEEAPDATEFKRVSLIGHGGYGDVFKVKYKNKVYAMKTSNTKLETNEAAILKLLKPCINVIDIFWVLSDRSIVLEFTSMGSIYDLIHLRGKLSYLEASDITRQTLKGLVAIHAAGIVHCDIKCSNLLIFPFNGVVKICDFGLSQFANKTRSNEGHEGSIYWLAPELVKNYERKYDFKCDVWSVGCSVLEMINGVPPFNEYGYARVLHLLSQLATMSNMLVSVGDSNCLEFLNGCFVIDPARRSSVEDLLNTTWVKTGRNLLKYVEFKEEDEKDQFLQKFQDSDSDSDGLEINDVQLLTPSKARITNLLITQLKSNKPWDSALHLANDVYRMDNLELEKLVYSGYLPQLLSGTPTESLHAFIKIMKAHPEGLKWFKIAGGEVNPLTSNPKDP